MSRNADSSGTAAVSSGEDARIAVIDIGSNSVRLVVAQVLPDEGYRILNEERENTRLASILASTGSLGTTAMNQTRAALRNFLTIAEGFGVHQVRAIATSAVREAVNGRSFCRRIQVELQLKVEIINPRKEARLAFLSVARAFDLANHEVAVTDIGGASTEIILASSGLVEQAYTTHLGAVRLAEQCKVTTTCGEKGLLRLQRTIDRELKYKLGKPPFVPVMLFGMGGTFTSLASIILARLGQAEEPLQGSCQPPSFDCRFVTSLFGKTLRGTGTESQTSRHHHTRADGYRLRNAISKN
jgi:exopolyphosphatase/guanosine-5'-triphosphate,3'-diphosphate pyrophosphatase